MKELELKESVRNFLTKHINVEFEDSDNFFEKRYVNSLFAMQLVNYLEQQFNLEIDGTDMILDNFKSINSIVSFIQKKFVN